MTFPGTRKSRSHWRSLLVRGVLGVALGSTFLYLAARDVSMAQAWADLGDYDYGWVGGMLAFWTGAVYLRVKRWQGIFPIDATPPRGAVFNAFAIGGLANNALPGRLGDLVRVGLIQRHTSSISVGGTLATIVLEKIVDGLIVL